MTKKSKAIASLKKQPYRACRFGIQNHWGCVWTSETFQTPEQARKYLEQQRPKYGGLTKKHKVVPVRVTISIIRSRVPV